MNNNEFSKALVDVRKAYRLVYLYTASILDAVQRISQEYNCNFYAWTPMYYSNSPKLTTSPFSRWAWNMLPFYNTSFLFLSEGADPNKQKKGDWLLDIYIETDSSAADKFYENDNEPNPLEFEPPEKAESSFWLQITYCSKPNKFNWYYDFWRETDYPEKEFGTIEEYRGLKYVGRKYELSKLFTEKSLLESVTDFKNLVKKYIPEIKEF